MGFLLCCVFILYTWNKYFTDPVMGSLYYQELHLHNVFERNMPSDERFLSLCFSAARHGIVFLISAALIYFVNINILSKFLLFLNFLYTYLKVWTQLQRSKSARGAGTGVKAALRASCAVAVYSILLTISLYGVYFIRP